MAQPPPHRYGVHPTPNPSQPPPPTFFSVPQGTVTGIGGQQPRSYPTTSFGPPPPMGSAPPPPMGSAPPPPMGSALPLPMGSAPPPMGPAPPSMGSAPPPRMSSAPPPAMGTAPPHSMGSAPPPSMGSAPPPSMGSAPPPSFGSAPPSTPGTAPVAGSYSAPPPSRSGPSTYNAPPPAAPKYGAPPPTLEALRQAPPTQNGPPSVPLMNVAPTATQFQPQPPNIPPSQYQGYPNPTPQGPNFAPSGAYPALPTPASSGYAPGVGQQMGAPMGYPARLPTSTSTPSTMGVPQQQQMRKPEIPKPKIDPSQIPSPIHQFDLNKPLRFGTRSNQPPPPASSQFFVVDEANCSPRFIRSSLYTVPTSASILKSLHLPFSLIVQPLADPAPGEEPVPVVDFQREQIIRCQRCRAYINCACVFLDGGRAYKCSICEFINQVPPFFFCPLDPTGNREDLAYRPELRRGSVEFVATNEFINRPPKPLDYLFVVEVTYQSITSGFLSAFVQAVKQTLSALPADTKSRFGFITFDSSIHFYNLNPKLRQPQMMVVPDIQEVFVPIDQDSLLVNYFEARELVDSLLDKLPTMFEASKANQTALGTAITAGHQILEQIGGKLLVFSCTLPTLGAGKLLNRLDFKILGTDKEKVLYQEQSEFYTKLAAQCADSKVGVDLFLLATSYIDVATLGILPKLTCGQLYFYPQMNKERLIYDVHQNISRTTGFDAVMRIRCSKGLSVSDYYGSYSMKLDSGEFDLASIDSDKTFSVVLKHDEQLEERTPAVVQCALLYTTSSGQRRIRVLTLALPCSSNFNQIFRFADLDVVSQIFFRSAASKSKTLSLSSLRSSIIESCTNILFAYRKFCSTSSFGGQLILPESLKLLPIYALSMLKNGILRPGSEVKPDERSYLCLLLDSLSPGATSLFIYPRIFALHNVANLQKDGNLVIPPPLRLSIELLEQNGLYVLHRGCEILLWVSKNLPAEISNALFEKQQVATVEASELQLVQSTNEISNQIQGVIQNLQAISNYLPIRIIKQGEPTDAILSSSLVEDKGPADLMTYVDFLCHVHREILSKLSDG